MALPLKKVRKANFNTAECFHLLEEIRIEREAILEKINNSLTVRKKREIWDAIACRINAVHGNERTVEELKKKFKDIKKIVQQQQGKKKKTGGWKGEQQSLFTEAINAIIGDGSYLAEGINVDGMDSYVSDHIQYSPNQDIKPDQDLDFSDQSHPQVCFEQSQESEFFHSKPSSPDSIPPKNGSDELFKKWLQSDIKKNESIVELNKHKIAYIKFMMANKNGSPAIPPNVFE